MYRKRKAKQLRIERGKMYEELLPKDYDEVLKKLCLLKSLLLLWYLEYISLKIISRWFRVDFVRNETRSNCDAAERDKFRTLIHEGTLVVF